MERVSDPTGFPAGASTSGLFNVRSLHGSAHFELQSGYNTGFESVGRDYVNVRGKIHQKNSQPCSLTSSGSSIFHCAGWSKVPWVVNLKELQNFNVKDIMYESDKWATKVLVIADHHSIMMSDEL